MFDIINNHCILRNCAVNKMSDTIENLNIQITEKLQYLETIYDQISSLCVMFDGMGISYVDLLSQAFIYVNIIIAEIRDLKDKYQISVVHVLSAYYSLRSTQNLETKSILSNSFDEFITEEGLTRDYFKILKLNGFGQEMEKYLSKAKQCIEIMLKRYSKIRSSDISDPIYVIAKRIMNTISSADANKIVSVVVVKNSDENDDTCECGGAMRVRSSTSEVICTICSRVKTMYGTAMDDSQAGDGSRNKHSSYDYLRHFKSWLHRIQAKTKKNITEENSVKIRATLNAEGFRHVDLNIEKMRRVLKKCGLTEYNDDCPYLIFYLTGRSPPELSLSEMKQFQSKFARIMELRQMLKEEEGDTDGNRPYYPYYIYKITEIVFEGNNEKLKLLDFIHLQSDETLRKHDNEFKKIVSKASVDDGLKYIPTCRR